MTDDLTATRGDTREAPDERHGMSENEAAAAGKRAGYDCWWSTCDKTVRDEALVRTRPKGQAGEFMCAQHAHQRALEELLP